MAVPLRCHPLNEASSRWISASVSTAIIDDSSPEPRSDSRASARKLQHGWLCQSYRLKSERSFNAREMRNGERRLRCPAGAGGKHSNLLHGICEMVDLRVDLLAQVFPDRVWHIEEHAHNIRIELPPGEAFHFFTGHLNALRRAIRTIGSDGIERICNGEDTRAQRDRLAA